MIICAIDTAINHETARNTYFATGEAPIMYMQFAEIPMLEKSLPDDFEYGFFNFPAFEDGKGDPKELTGAPEGFMISNKAKNSEPERQRISVRDTCWESTVRFRTLTSRR